MYPDRFDAIVVGGGPGGLSAAEQVASRNSTVLVVEQNREIGSPTRTSGGSFIRDAIALNIPETLYHPVSRIRMISPRNQAVFNYDKPDICIFDVRRLFQFLAERAVSQGATLSVNTTFTDILREGSYVVGIVAKDFAGREVTFRSDVVIDATGYRALVSKRAGMNPGFQRFGVGAEYDLYAPHFDQSEALLIVGNQIAPCGYAWAFPYGGHRVRLGVGVIHADSDAKPELYLTKLMDEAATYGMDLRGAQPLEYHYGLIPSDGLAGHFVGDGVLAVGDAAGQASALVGEGIRWAIKGGKMAGEVAAKAAQNGDVSAAALGRYERKWRDEFGSDLRIAAEINKRISHWSDRQWDLGFDLLKGLSARQFSDALQSNFRRPWVAAAVATNPKLISAAGRVFLRRLLVGAT